jgi:enterobacterial common antigen flippase
MSIADIPASTNRAASNLPANALEKRDNVKSTSHRQILKSSAIVGGSSVVTIVFGVVRTKIMAVLLGPAGIGLVGVLDSVIQLSRTLASLGIDASGVRQIAEAKGKEDQHAISVTVLCLRRACMFLGLAGGFALYLLRYRVSWWSFGNITHAGAIGWLSIAVFFSVVSAGQTALLQGLRRIWEYATIKIMGALCALVFSVPIIYFWGQDGIVTYLLIIYVSTLATSWWHARKIGVLQQKVSWREQAKQFRSLAKWGAVFLASASTTAFVLYASRALVIRNMGLEAAGQFQAAVALGLIYVGFILSAMGTDFYPMLTANANDNAVCNKLVNEQISISLLVGIPGVAGTLVFGDFIIRILYSGKFLQAADILCWLMPGVLMRLAVWPLGIALAAKGRSSYFLLGDVVNAGVQILLLEILTKAKYLGVVGAASTVAYFVSLPVLTLLLYRSSRFVWTRFNSCLLVLGLSTTGIALAMNIWLRGLPRIVVGLALVGAISWYSIHKTARLTGHMGIAALGAELKSHVLKKMRVAPGRQEV